ncbi:MAG: ATP-binding protein, partial [Desulfobacula sp.]
GFHDNGPGVTPDQTETIFDPGFTTKTGGTGLGLLSVQALASSCFGKISLGRSHLGGAVFRLIIPIERNASTGN